MPLYEYYCERCDKVFEALRSLRQSDQPSPCPVCGRDADRIMPTSFASMSRKQGWAQRVPFHHRPIRAMEPKRTIAPVKPKGAKKRSRKSGAGKEE
jgi:putative FmdB family regulatory protein